MRSAAGLGFLLALGIWAGHALAAPAPTQLPTTTLPITTALPTLPTTTVPLPTSTTVPKLPTTTTVPKLPTTTTVPKLPTTTTVPKLPTTTTVPKLPTTTTVPKLPTTTTSPAVPGTTTATSGSTAPVPPAAKAAGSLGSSAAIASLAATDARTSGSSASAGPEGARGSPDNSAQPQVQLETSRPFIATKGPRSKRAITLKFVLSKPARVIFAVQQVSPVCRTIGYFSVRGRKGINRIRFAGRVGRKRLGPGTYTIFARTRGGGLVQRVTLVVVDTSKPSRAQLRAARAANVCSDARDPFSVAAAGGASIGFASRARPEHSSGKAFVEGQPKVTETPKSGGVLGVTLEETARAVRPFLVGLLAAAILALGLGALPAVAVPGNRLSDALARRRIEITTVGAAALVAVAIAFLIG